MRLWVGSILVQHDARQSATDIALTTKDLHRTDTVLDVDYAHACVVG